MSRKVIYNGFSIKVNIKKKKNYQILPQYIHTEKEKEKFWGKYNEIDDIVKEYI